jgi:uncharacterized membrane protein
MSEPTAPSSPPPEPPSEPAVAAPGASPPVLEGSGLPPNLAAALACVPLVGGIVFLVLEKKDQFVRFYAMQSVILGGLSIACSISLQIVSWFFASIPFVGRLFAVLLGLVGMIVGLACFVAWLITTSKAFTGKEWEIPYLGKIARQQLAARAPTTP